MAVIGWLDPETDFETWADAPEPGEMVEELWAAYDKCLEWAPQPVPDPLPEATRHRYKLAQRFLVQHLVTRKRAGDGEGFGADGYMRQTYPLVREAYDALRPKRSPLDMIL